MFNRNSIRDHYPCRDFPDGVCPERHPGCQDHCEKMLKAKEKAKARKHVERQNRAHDWEVSGFELDARQRNGIKHRQI